MAENLNSWTLYEAAHLLNRAGYGGTPSEIREFHARGRENAVEWLLAANESEDFPAPSWVEVREEEEIEFRKSQERLKELTGAELDVARREMRMQAAKLIRERKLSLLGWWMDRMRRTDSPLREKMVFFWHDHFATSIQKVRFVRLMYRQNQLFREEALGNFGKLTHQIIEDPAMMVYLDSAQSNKKKPNENFARELMELFTLGEGAYTEEDIKEAARAFTGYRVNRRTGKVGFTKRRWDEGEKTILGETGRFNGEDVTRLVLKQPACARYLVGKLWEYFSYEKPSSQVVDRLAQVFVKHDYELKPLLRELFLAKEFYSEQAIRSQIKSPVEYVVKMSRQLEMDKIPDSVLLQTLTQLGQVPFQPPNVAGWDWGRAWVNTNTLLTRYHFAGLILGVLNDPKNKGQRGKKGFFGGAKFRSLPKPDIEGLVPRAQREDIPALVNELGFRLFQAPLREKDRVAFESYAKAMKGEIFTNTEVSELIHVMMSTPSYQLS